MTQEPFEPLTVKDPLTLVDVREKSGRVIFMQVWWAVIRTNKTGEEIIGITDQTGWFA